MGKMFSVFIKSKTQPNIFCHIISYPFGLLSFVLTITFLGISIGFITAHFSYQTWNFDLYIWQIDTLFESIVLFIAGFILLIFILFLCNWLAAFFKKIIQLLFNSHLNKQDRNIQIM